MFMYICMCIYVGVYMCIYYVNVYLIGLSKAYLELRWLWPIEIKVNTKLWLGNVTLLEIGHYNIFFFCTTCLTYNQINPCCNKKNMLSFLKYVLEVENESKHCIKVENINFKRRESFMT